MVVVDIVAAIDFNRLFRDWKRKEEKGQEQAEQNGSKVGRMLIVLRQNNFKAPTRGAAFLNFWFSSELNAHVLSEA